MTTSQRSAHVTMEARPRRVRLQSFPVGSRGAGVPRPRRAMMMRGGLSAKNGLFKIRTKLWEREIIFIPNRAAL